MRLVLVGVRYELTDVNPKLAVVERWLNSQEERSAVFRASLSSTWPPGLELQDGPSNRLAFG